MIVYSDRNLKGNFAGGIYREYTTRTTSVTFNYTYANTNYASVGDYSSNATIKYNNNSGFITSANEGNGNVWLNTSGINSMVYWLNGERNSGEWIIDTTNTNKTCYGHPYLKGFPIPATWTWGE